MAGDLDALDDEFLVGIGDLVFLVGAGGVDGFADVPFVVRLRLLGAVSDDALYLLVGNESTLRALEFGGARRQVEHVALANELVGALGVEDDAGVERGGNLEGDAAGNVRLDDAGDHIGARRLGGDDEMDAGRAGFLGDPGDAHFHIRRGGLHEVGELVDQHNDVGETIGDFILLDLQFLEIRLGPEITVLQRGGDGLDLVEVGFRLVHFRDHRGGFLFRARAVVETVEVPHALLGEDLVAFLHLVDHPLEGGDGLFRIGDDRHDHVRELVVHLHLHDLGIDHDETQLVGAELEQDGGDDRVDADGFPGTRGTRNEEVGHGGEVTDDRFSVNVLAEGERDFLFRGAELGVVQELVERHGDLAGVRDLDADGVLAGDGGEDVDALGAGGAGDVRLKLRDAGNAEAGGGINLVTRDRGAAGDIAGRDVDAEGFQGLDDRGLDLEQFGVVCGLGLDLHVI